MKLKDKELKILIKELFRTRTTYNFNCIRVGTAFRIDVRGLIVGGEDGIIRIYDSSSNIIPAKPKILLETKGGPIQTMAIHDVTKFYDNDLVTGDSVGMMTIFCNQQILCRHRVAKDSIRCLLVHKDPLGSCCIVASDESGYICGLLPSKELWRININDLSNLKCPTQKMVITCMLSTELVTPTGEKCCYILAADDNKHLHFIHQGDIVMTLSTPEVISAMCSGHFIDVDKLDIVTEPGSIKVPSSQVALGCKNGAIYILHNFTITEEEICNSKYYITNMLSHPTSNPNIDMLLCAGHFNALHVYHEGKNVGNFETPDWICSMDVSTNQNSSEVIVGCLDKSILALTLAET
ncbi:hypothetical protein ACF0H5_002314 [Mactra antiquata]